MENRHSVHAAITNAAGNLLYAVGDLYRMTLARSAAKPAQALAILQTGAVNRFHFDDADLAFMCASNSSEERHIARAWSMLSKVSACQDDLCCGGHPPLSKTVQRAWIKSDFTPTPVCSNCSGKHVGMIPRAKVLGDDVADYHLSTRPIQMHLKRVDDVCDLGENGLLIGKLGADGCYGIGIRECEQTRCLGAESAIGISAKIEDGNIHVLYLAVAEILEQLKIGESEMRQALSAFSLPRGFQHGQCSDWQVLALFSSASGMI